MLTDARLIAGGATFQADLCIVGGGAAGLSIALEFADGPLTVLLLEGGGLKTDPDSQALYRGASVGLPYADLETARVRYLGGTTNREGWGGWCKPLDQLDFDKRDWVPYSGWPITRADLDPYYKRAHGICQLGPYDYDLRTWLQRVGRNALEILPLDGRIRTEIQQLGPPTRFGTVYRPILRRAQNIDLHLHANAVEIETTADGSRAVSVRVKTLTGVQYRVEARAFVLATGGIENARLLLASNRVHSAGLGNHHDLVGRFFMDHIRVDAGELALSNPKMSTRFYDPAPTFIQRARAVEGAYDHRLLTGSLTLSPEAQRSESLLNYRAWLVTHYTDYESSGVKALRQLYLASRDRQLPARPARLLADIAKDLGQVSSVVFDRFVRSRRRVGTRFLVNIVEPEPNPDSRVTILRERDALGVPKVQIDWQLGPNVTRTLARAHKILDAEFSEAGVGRLDHPFTDADGVHQPSHWVWHHMGTTRMHDEPRRGVVDRDCRVHGVSNLFVAGSSVFPTCGNDMPTLTIVALALRLADRLKDSARHA